MSTITILDAYGQPVKLNASGTGTPDDPFVLAVGSTETITPYTDASGTITLGGTVQGVLPINAARTGVMFQNMSDTDMYVNPTGTATTGAGSYLVKAGGSVYETPTGVKDSQALSVLCATTGKAYTAKWW